MASDSSWVYGLRHQARCLTAVASKDGGETSKFLVGTVGVRNNLVCLLEFDESKSEIVSTLYEHPDEVWDISSSPVNETLLFTCHSQVGNDPRQRKATLWKRNSVDAASEEGVGTKHALQQLMSLENEGVSRVLWDPTSQENTSRVACTCAQQLHVARLNNASTTTEISIDTSTIYDKDEDDGDITNAAWNPHDTQNMITTIGSNLAGWDFRSGKTSFTKHRAHKSTVRALDYNPNKPYHVVTGGDDALVSIWDVRQLSSPAMTVEGHTHWVWSVAFNRFHDQLLLTSGSDTLVNLHNVVSVSSASYLRSEEQTSQEDENNHSEGYWSSYRPSDGLICTYDQHEDSVYASVWSTADTWTFASLSYAGRVVISQVPTGEKFKILGV